MCTKWVIRKGVLSGEKDALDKKNCVSKNPKTKTHPGHNGKSRNLAQLKVMRREGGRDWRGFHGPIHGRNERH